MKTKKLNLSKLLKAKMILGIFVLLMAALSVKCGIVKIDKEKLKETICMNYSESAPPTLEKEFIEDMKRNYFENQLSVLNNLSDNKNSLEDGDTQSVRFDLEELKKFIYYVEINAQKNKIATADLGIRMHFITYPNQEAWGLYNELKGFDKAKEYSNRISLILVPTKKEKDIHFDYNLLTNEKINFKLYNFKTSSTREAVSTSLNAKQDVLALNHANLIPPAIQQ